MHVGANMGSGQYMIQGEQRTSDRRFILKDWEKISSLFTSWARISFENPLARSATALLIRPNPMMPMLLL
jgi:hypothetical protein